MSVQLVRNYQRELGKVKDLGAKNEMALKRPFSNLLYALCQAKNLTLVEEISIKNAEGKTIRPDGIVKGVNRLDWGYWESKDEADDIEDEIKKKFAKGYPNDNIIFEDTNQAILYQNGKRVATADMQDEGINLYALLQQFVSFERPEYTEFRQALENFKTDIPPIIRELRKLMDEEAKGNKEFVAAKNKFLKICQDSINPNITDIDIREMLVQHILTEDIFTTIFDEADFHKSNNIAFELENVLKTFFKKDIKRNFYPKIRNYYAVIKTVAARIEDVREKQTFLKVIYEDFYKAYNPKGADRLGIVYTPNEIVRFMIESTDHLLYEHFGKELLSEGVEILDPATGTGTFITDLIDYFPSTKKEQIKRKYANELHANEVSILPYYIANLNIEYAYQQKTGEYKEFENLVFVDTLDNMGFGFTGKQTGLFTSLSAENLDRIKRQNERKISVIIGNPPYNSRQANYNDDNANRTYPDIDKRIKDTFIKEGTAQSQIVVYDMYTRFYRWAMDRIDINGVIAFVTNRSFIDGRAFDGFRKCLTQDFSDIYIVDTQSDVRANPKIAGTTHNIFGIQTGVAILFLIKKEGNNKNRLNYFTLTDEMLKKDKLEWLRNTKIQNIPFELIKPNKKNNWINLADNNFDDLIAIMDKDVKAGKDEKAIFKLFSLGIATHRDSWNYDFSKEILEKKIDFFIKVYQNTLIDDNYKDKKTIAWDADLDKCLKRKISKKLELDKIVLSVYRPYVKKWLYFDKHLNSRTYQWFDIYPSNKLHQKVIIIPGLSSPKEFHTYCTESIIDLNALPAGSQSLPLYRYTNEGRRVDNITQWAVNEFRNHYSQTLRVSETLRVLEREDIFHYVYGVLHNPAYRQKYELNLKREFPRIPFYSDFWFWAEKGKELMELHLDYENVEKYDLQREENTLKSSSLNKAKLKADKTKNEIYLDEQTTLKNIPASAWEYKLGNRSALEWILDQYKEKKPSDETIKEKFNTYKFEDYKEQVIELLQRVCTVSVKTMEIVGEMKLK